MRYVTLFFVFFLLVFSGCQPKPIENELAKIQQLERKLSYQKDSLRVIQQDSLVLIEASLQQLLDTLRQHPVDSTQRVFIHQLLQDGEKIAFRIQQIRQFRDTLQSEITFSETQLQNLSEDLHQYLLDTKQFDIFCVQETKSINNQGKLILDNNQILRKEIQSFEKYRFRIQGIVSATSSSLEEK